MGRSVARAQVMCDGQCIALAQIVQKTFRPFGTVGLLSRGPIWTTHVDDETKAQALRKLRETMPGCGFRVLLNSPETDAPGQMPLYSACSVAEIDLHTDQSVMRQRLHGKWRNALRRAESSGLRVVATRNPQTLVQLIDRDGAQQRAQRYRNYPPAFFAHWVKQDPSSFVIYRAMLGGDSVAEMLFLDHAPGVTYQIGWTAGAGRTFAAHNLLLWNAIVDYAKAGRTRLDLGQIDTVNAPGLARFKLGTGARSRTLGPTGLVLPKMPDLRRSHGSRSTSTGTAA